MSKTTKTPQKQTKVAKTNKTIEIKKHLEKNKSITSLEAIKLFSATRLSAIIFVLRKHKGMNITTKPLSIKDKYGNDCTYAQYLYHPKVKQSVSVK